VQSISVVHLNQLHRASAAPRDSAWDFCRLVPTACPRPATPALAALAIDVLCRAAGSHW